MKGFLRASTFAALGVGVLAWPSAWLLDRFAGREVLIVVPADAASVEANRSIWTKGEPVAPIYGTPSAAPARLLFPDESRILRPAEDPSLTLFMEKQGEHALRSQNLLFASRYVAVGGIVAGILGLLLYRKFCGT